MKEVMSKFEENSNDQKEERLDFYRKEIRLSTLKY